MRARSDDFLRFAEYLAHHEELPPGAARPIAAELEIPYTTLIEWWRHFEFQRALIASPAGIQVDRPRILQVLTSHRLARLTPRFDRTIGMDARTASTILEERGIPHALGMLSAGNEWAFFEPRRDIQIYVAAGMLTRVRAALPAAPSGFRLEVFSDNPEQLPIVTRGGVPITSQFLTLLDCRAHPEGGAHANFLERNVIQWGRTPRSRAA